MPNQAFWGGGQSHVINLSGLSVESCISPCLCRLLNDVNCGNEKVEPVSALVTAAGP